MHFSLSQSYAVVHLDLCEHIYNFSFSYLTENQRKTTSLKFCDCSKALFKWIVATYSVRPPKKEEHDKERRSIKYLFDDCNLTWHTIFFFFFIFNSIHAHPFFYGTWTPAFFRSFLNFNLNCLFI